MNEEKIQSGLEEIKKIRMTSDEKKLMLSNVLSSSLSYSKSIKSPWYSFVSITSKKRFTYYGVALCLIVLLSGREIVFASEGSLPGNALYPIKVNVVEPIRAALKFSTEEKAQYESSLATKRLVEAETLAADNKLDESKEKELNILLTSHTVAMEENLDKLRKNESSEDAVDDIVINFEAGMNAHARVLDVLDKHENNKNNDQDNKISKIARTNGSKIRNSFKGKENGKSDTYTRKKKVVQSIIDSTTKDLDDSTISTSAVQQTIIDDTHKTLDEAKQLLDKVSTDDQKENSEDNYKALLDSESSAKEASIFLKASLKLRSKNSNRKTEEPSRVREESNQNNQEIPLKSDLDL